MMAGFIIGAVVFMFGSMFGAAVVSNAKKKD